MQNVIADKRNLWQNIQLTPFFLSTTFSLAVCILISLCIPKIRLILVADHFFYLLRFTLHLMLLLWPFRKWYRSVCEECVMVVMSFDMHACPDSCLCIRVYSTITIRAQRTTERNFVCKSNFSVMENASSFRIVHCISSLWPEKMQKW